LIVKKRTVPREMTIYEAIVRRFPINHPRKAEFERKLSRKRAGYKGEKELDYHISQIDHAKYTIIEDIRIPHNNTHFQIDSLLISNSFIIPIESKNYAGTLEFHPDFQYLIQNLNGVEKVYGDPILQAKTQANQLKSFLISNQFSPPPFEPLVAITNLQAIIKNPTQSKEVSHRVFKSPAIFYKTNPIQEKYQIPYLSEKEIKKIVKLLLKKHTPFIPDIKAMDLPYGDMLKGVECPSCHTFGMEKIHGYWGCKHCGHISKDAHLSALKDYFLIYGPTITNSQFREYLGISSVDQAKRMLSAMGLESTGSTKGRIYTPGENFQLWE